QMDREAWPDMKARIAAVIATRTRDEWLETFARADTQYAPVLEPAEALDDVHNRSRHMVRDLAGPRGTLRQIGCPVRRENPITRAASPPGAESRVILEEIGFDEARIASLLKEET